MSDYEDDDDMMEYDDEDEGEEMDEDDPAVQIENQYFEAKDAAEKNAKDGIKAFEKVISMEAAKSKWGFKALKRICKICHKLAMHDEVIKRYRLLMSYTKSAVTLNESEKALNSLLEHVADSPHVTEMYELTLDTFRSDKNEKACLRLGLKLAKVLYQKKDFVALEKSLKKLYQATQLPDGTPDPSKGSQLMEIYAQEILMHTETGNRRRLKELYEKALKIVAAIPSPRINGIIHECGGKMHMREKTWGKAHEDFFEAFKNYDEAGSPRRIQCLKYLALASILMGSDIDPFEERRAKSYKNSPEIVAMIELVGAYQRSDVPLFEKVLQANRKHIMEDDFMADYIQDLLTKMRTQVLLNLIRPYTHIRLDFLSKALNVKTAEVEALLVTLILDNLVNGRIDQVAGQLELYGGKSAQAVKYTALHKWGTQVDSLNRAVLDRLV